jgi:hypothetical protein
VCGSERHAVVAADVGGQAALLKKPLKRPSKPASSSIILCGMSQPTPPYFLWNIRQHFLDCVTALDAEMAGKRVSRLTLVKEYDSHCTIYDSEGVAWGFHFVGRKEKYSLFDRFLAEVYNPAREFPVSYSQRGHYVRFSKLPGKGGAAISLLVSEARRFLPSPFHNTQPLHCFGLPSSRSERNRSGEPAFRRLR